MKKIAFWAILALTLILSAHAEVKDGLNSEAELGFVSTSGNTRVQTLNVKDLSTYKHDANVYSIFGSYLSAKTSSVNTAKNWNLGVKYERLLTEKFSFFLGQKVEGDKFQSIKQRYSTDIGGKYYLVKEEKMSWFSELGYRLTRENQAALKKTYQYARLYTESEKKWNESVSSKVWIEYLPNFTVWSDYQLNSEVSITAVLTSIFSFKTAYLTKYDNQPAAGVSKKTDSVFTTNLVAKF